MLAVILASDPACDAFGPAVALYEYRVVPESRLYLAEAAIEHRTSLVYHQDSIAQFLHLIHHVSAHDYSLALASKLTNEILQDLGVHRVECCEGFVEDYQLRIM